MKKLIIIMIFVANIAFSQTETNVTVSSVSSVSSAICMTNSISINFIPEPFKSIPYMMDLKYLTETERSYYIDKIANSDHLPWWNGTIETIKSEAWCINFCREQVSKELEINNKPITNSNKEVTEKVETVLVHKMCKSGGDMLPT